jgi:hypothetical protein
VRINGVPFTGLVSRRIVHGMNTFVRSDFFVR